MLFEQSCPVTGPAFVDMICSTLSGYRRTKNNHIAKTHKIRHEVSREFDRQVLGYFERHRKIKSFLQIKRQCQICTQKSRLFDLHQIGCRITTIKP